MISYNKVALKNEIKMNASAAIQTQNQDSTQIIEQIIILINAVISKKSIELTQLDKNILAQDIFNDLTALGPLQDLMDNDEISEIMVNGPYQIIVEKNGNKEITDKSFDDENHLQSILDKMLKDSSKRLDKSQPFADFSLSDGSRINAIIPPLSVDGITITIRKFLDTIESLDDLLNYQTINNEMMKFLKKAIKAKLNILFSGATGSGKTSTLNVLSNEINNEERIITIEDALELKINKPHVIRLLTRSKNIENKGEIKARDLFTNTLRMRPSRIILGELRGEEAFDFLQAVNSGHEGTFAVLHSSTPYDAVARLQTLAMFANLNIPSHEIKRQIASGVDLIIQHEQLTDGSRKITSISEIKGIEEGDIILNELFNFEIVSINEDSKVDGKFNTINKSISDKFLKNGILL